MDWPSTPSAATFAPIPGREHHQLDVFLPDGQLVDVRLDGESVFPTWFKLEFKESGELSAKVRGVRLSTRLGDTIVLHTRQA